RTGKQGSQHHPDDPRAPVALRWWRRLETRTHEGPSTDRDFEPHHASVGVAPSLLVTYPSTHGCPTVVRTGDVCPHKHAPTPGVAERSHSWRRRDRLRARRRRAAPPCSSCSPPPPGRVCSVLLALDLGGRPAPRIQRACACTSKSGRHHPRLHHPRARRVHAAQGSPEPCTSSPSCQRRSSPPGLPQRWRIRAARRQHSPHHLHQQPPTTALLGVSTHT